MVTTAALTTGPAIQMSTPSTPLPGSQMSGPTTPLGGHQMSGPTTPLGGSQMSAPPTPLSGPRTPLTPTNADNVSQKNPSPLDYRSTDAAVSFLTLFLVYQSIIYPTVKALTGFACKIP